MTQIKLKKTNHFIHAILTLLTCALWAIPWVLITNANNRHNDMLMAQGDTEDREKKDGNKWTKFEVISSWLSCVFISFATFMLTNGFKDEAWYIVPFVLLVVASNTTYEYITGKNKK